MKESMSSSQLGTTITTCPTPSAPATKPWCGLPGDERARGERRGVEQLVDEVVWIAHADDPLHRPLGAFLRRAQFVGVALGVQLGDGVAECLVAAQLPADVGELVLRCRGGSAMRW